MSNQFFAQSSTSGLGRESGRSEKNSSVEIMAVYKVKGEKKENKTNKHKRCRGNQSLTTSYQQTNAQPASK